MNKKLVVANWKLHFTVPESTITIERLKKELAKIKDSEVVICPSFLDIYPASAELKGTNLSLGAQNLFYKEEGAYTGEVSAVALAHFVKYVIVGHSERRLMFSENDKVISQKAEVAVAHEITPIICVGETLHDKEDGLSKIVVVNQLEAALNRLTASEVAEVVIAYEPVWAIGTGRICKITEAEKMSDDVRNLIKALYGERAAKEVRIIYGGSIDEKNVNSFAKSKKLDGILVGGASLDYHEFSKIVGAFELSDKKAKK
ncbi:MAG: triose-phosphate isomerase [Patescibacteria group bacterium]|jgi:triosephosphate isomerase|nr:triose-phosphate isomerase [Patescibacteria group bacterium]